MKHATREKKEHEKARHEKKDEDSHREKSAYPAREGHKKEGTRKRREKTRESEIMERLEQKERQYQDMLNTLKRVQADFDNYRKRNERDARNLIEMANAGLVQKLLPVLDSFEECLKQKHDEGVKTIYSQLIQILKSEGLERIESKGKPFDPFLHEALMVEPTDKKELDNTIVEEFQAGYSFRGRVLRHAKVKVAKIHEKEQEEEREEKAGHNQEKEEKGSGNEMHAEPHTQG